MNKRDIAELKKQLSVERCNIERIAICYVNQKKMVQLKMKDHPLTFTSDETDKYFNIFKQSFNGKIGKKNFTLAFNDENDDFMEKLRDSELKDDDLLDEFYEKIIENYEAENDFLISVIYGSYQAESRYDYVHTAICPVEKKKPTLYYQSDQRRIVDSTRDLVIGKTDVSFLYPAFHDRGPDIYHMFVFSKNEKKLPENIIVKMLHLKKPLSSEEQKFKFQDIISMSLENKDADTLRGISYSLMKLVEERPEGFSVDADDLNLVLKENGVPEEERHSFKEAMKEADSPEFLVSNLVDKTTKVEMGDVDIKIPTLAGPSEFQIKEIDGRKYIMLPVMDTVYINDIVCKDKSKNEEKH